jgi:hypothetical protein
MKFIAFALVSLGFASFSHASQIDGFAGTFSSFDPTVYCNVHIEVVNSRQLFYNFVGHPVCSNMSGHFADCRGNRCTDELRNVLVFLPDGNMVLHYRSGFAHKNWRIQ